MKGQSLFYRVWNKVEFTPTCWNWIGALSKKRRGKRPHIQIGGRGSKVVSVARLVCEWYHGPPPTIYHEAGHLCDKTNYLCINPEHL